MYKFTYISMCWDVNQNGSFNAYDVNVTRVSVIKRWFLGGETKKINTQIII